MRKNYFLFKTAGSSFANTGFTYKIQDIIAKLGYRLKHEQLYVMPPIALARQVLQKFSGAIRKVQKW